MRDLRLGDSVVIDPHKNLGVSYPSSLVLFRNGDDFRSIRTVYGNIVNDPASFDLGTTHPIEGSRGFHSLKLWFLIRYYGLAGIAELLERKHDIAAYFHQKLGETDVLFPLHEVSLFNQAFASCRLRVEGVGSRYQRSPESTE